MPLAPPLALRTLCDVLGAQNFNHERFVIAVQVAPPSGGNRTAPPNPGADVADGEPSPGADVAAGGRVPVQMWQTVGRVPVQMWQRWLLSALADLHPNGAAGHASGALNALHARAHAFRVPHCRCRTLLLAYAVVPSRPAASRASASKRRSSTRKPARPSGNGWSTIRSCLHGPDSAVLARSGNPAIVLASPEPSPVVDVAGGEPSSGTDVTGGGPSPVQMLQQ